MNQVLITELIEIDYEKVRNELFQGCTSEQKQLISEALISDEYIPVFETIEQTEDQLNAHQHMGMAALISYQNVLFFLGACDYEGALLPLTMATSASTLFHGQKDLPEVFRTIEKSARKEHASKGGKASDKAKYPWKEVLAAAARERWRKEDILHTDLTNWFITEYVDSHGKHPFSVPLESVEEGDERRKIREHLKKVAKEPEFAGRNLIYKGF